MKTETQNKNVSSWKIILLIAFVLVIKTTASPGLVHKVNRSEAEVREETSLAAAVFPEVDFIIEELDFADTGKTPEIEVMDTEDQIVFSGTEEEWEEAADKDLILIKRKAEFLLESNGTMIYKVF